MNIYKEYKEEKEGFRVGVLSKLIDLLLYFNRLIRNNPELNNIEYPDAKHREIAKITEYIHKNFRKDLSLEDISKRFNRKFKDIVGKTSSEYRKLKSEYIM